MENQIVKVFQNEEFSNVEIIVENGEPLFELYSTGMALGYITRAKGVVYPHKDRIDKIVKNAVIALVVRGVKLYLTESMLYDFLLESKSSGGRKFRQWVVNDVLPTIRKTGGYGIQHKVDSYMIDDPVERAKRWIEEYQERKALEQKIEADKPKVEFADHVADTSDLIDMSTLAKLAKKENIKIGRNRLFEWLRDNKYLMSNGKHKNEPYQKYVDNGWFVVREYTYNTAYGEQIGTKTYVTGKGQMGIIEKLRKDFI